MFTEYEQNFKKKFKINLNYNYCNNYNTFLGKMSLPCSKFVLFLQFMI